MKSFEDTFLGEPGGGKEKSNENRNVEPKNRESNRMFVIAINREFGLLNQLDH